MSLPPSDPPAFEPGDVDPAFPPILRTRIGLVLQQSIAGQPILAGETVVGLIARRCPEIYDIALDEGFELVFDLPQNTHDALCAGLVAMTVRASPKKRRFKAPRASPKKRRFKAPRG